MSLIISQKSWHYHFATRGGFRQHSPMELCFYTRRVLMGLLKTIVVFGAIGCAAYGALDLAMAAWFRSEPNIPGILFGIVLSIAGMVLGGLVVVAAGVMLLDGDSPVSVTKLLQKAAPRQVASTASIVAASYRGWKDRYCPTIEIQEPGA